MKEASATNFGHLKANDEQVVRLGVLAERYFLEDPNTCLLKLRQLTESMAQLAAPRAGLYASAEEKQTDLLCKVLAPEFERVSIPFWTAMPPRRT